MIVDQDSICACWRRLRQDPLQAPVWLALARNYAARDLPWQAGYAARQALRLDPALRCVLDRLAPGVLIDSVGDARLGRATLPEAEQLIERFAGAVAPFPGDWLSWLYLARLRVLQSNM